MKKIVFLFIALFSFINTNATHIGGGDIYLQHLDSNKYFLQLKLYRDCSGITMGSVQPITIENNCGAVLNFNVPERNQYFAMNNPCSSYYNTTSCNSGSNPGYNIHFYNDTITLPSSFTNCLDLHVSFYTCCRNNSTINALGNTQIRLESTFDFANFPNNSTPYFTNEITKFVDTSFTLDYSVTENDGDSIFYELVPPISGSSTSSVPLVFNQGYSGANPFGNSSIDSLTGIISATNVALGTYVFAVQASEYDRTSGMLKSRIIKEHQIIVTNNIATDTNTTSINILNINGGYMGNNDTIILNSNSLANISFYASHPNYATLLRSVYFSNPSLIDYASIPGIDTIQGVVNTTSYPPGVYSIELLSMIDTCTFSNPTFKTFYVKVEQVNAGVDTTICSGDTLWLNATNSQNSPIIWQSTSGTPINVGTNFGCDTCLSTWAIPSNNTTYTISETFGNFQFTDSINVQVDSGFTISGFAYLSDSSNFQGKAYVVIDSFNVPIIADSFSINSSSFSYQCLFDSVRILLAPDQGLLGGNIDANTYIGNTFKFEDAIVFDSSNCYNYQVNIFSKSKLPSFNAIHYKCPGDSYVLTSSNELISDWNTFQNGNLNFVDTGSTIISTDSTSTLYIVSYNYPFDDSVYQDSIMVNVNNQYNVNLYGFDENGSFLNGSVYVFQNNGGSITFLDTLQGLTFYNYTSNLPNIGFAFQPNNTNYPLIYSGNTYDISQANLPNLIGCQTDTILFSNTPMQLNLTNDTSICINNNLNLNVSGASFYQWTVINGDSLVLSQNFGCDTCSTTWASPSFTTTYQVTGYYNNSQLIHDTVTVTVNNTYTYQGSVASNNSGSFTGKVLLIRYNPTDSTVTAVDSIHTSNGMYAFNTNEANIFIKAVPDAGLLPFDIPTYYDSAAIFLGATQINGVYCDTVTNNFTTLSGINLGGNGFIAGNVYQGAGKSGHENPIENLSIVAQKKGSNNYKQIQTDEDGYFIFNDLNDGAYLITTDHPQVIDHTVEITLDSDNPNVNGVFLIENNTLLLESVMSTENVFISNTILAYPNPVESTLNIRTPTNSEYQILDITGKIVQSGQLQKGNNQIEVNNLYSGVFIINIASENKQEQIQIIKQ